jgi:hypothetical protein
MDTEMADTERPDTEIVGQEEAFQRFSKTISGLEEDKSEGESSSELEELEEIEDLSLDPKTVLMPIDAPACRRAKKRTKKRKSVGPEDHHKSK